MRTLILAFLFLLASANTLAQSKRIGTFEFVEKKANHTAKMIFKTKSFSRSNHKIASSREGLVSTIDGRSPLGTDGNLPHIEIESVKLYLDGRDVLIPKRLYSDCYEPSFQLNDSFAIRFADNSEGLFVFMDGSDAAGSYQVVWVFRKDGNHSRFSGACSDCEFIDFRSGFFR